MFLSGVHVLQYYRKKPKCQTYKWCHYTCTHYYMFGVRHDAVWYYYLCHAGNLILLPSKNINSFSSKYKSRIAYSWMWLPRWINIMMIIVGFHPNYPPSFLYPSVSIHVQCKYILSLSDACNCFSRWSSLLFDIWSAKQIVGDLCMAYFYIWATNQTKKYYQISTSDYGRCTGRTRDSSWHSLERSMTYIYLCRLNGLMG